MPKSKTAPTKKLPRGWFLAGETPSQFQVTFDTFNPHSGTRCVRLSHKTNHKGPCSWGTLMQEMEPQAFINQYLTLALWLRTESVEGWAAAWMRVDGQKLGEVLGFDNMWGQHIKGTTKWTRYEITLAVPPASSNIAFGVMLGGKGHVFMDDVSFEVMAEDILIVERQPVVSDGSGCGNPVNLDFEADD